jgi:hypothetical protein
VVSRGFVVAIPGEANRSSRLPRAYRSAHVLTGSSRLVVVVSCPILEREPRLPLGRLGSQWLNGHYERRTLLIDAAVTRLRLGGRSAARSRRLKGRSEHLLRFLSTRALLSVVANRG